MSVAEPGNCWDAIPGVEDYDSILNILDFPLESLEDDGFVSDWDITKSHCLGPIPSAVLMDSKPLFLSPSSGLVPPPNKPPEESSSVFQTQSPVSVLESSGPGPALIKNSPNPIPVRARSKRVKRQSPWLSASTNYFTSGERREIPILPPVVTKRCAHCDVTKTPQWREGPMGPKTLCNACGVRYRSGRLFPEYRPAASPTFVPALHSNSHKKVIEMRTKRRGPRAGVEKGPTSPQPEFVPMSNYLFDYMY